ncbi:hypothetical protein ACFQLX_03270 [Streptomyces polyrhachis]|uniref:Uncharacterized protein n=1 Tax=Streptomyces polyrhachis TaxID=1282885 RepID=A0ABW2GBG9_9ACTN
MTWTWEYDPSEEHVVHGAPLALVAEVERKADELVRAAAALHLHGSADTGHSPGGGTALVPGGMFEYQVIPRHERVYVMQITGW